MKSFNFLRICRDFLCAGNSPFTWARQTASTSPGATISTPADKRASRALLSGTACAFFIFVLFSAFLPESQVEAEAVEPELSQGTLVVDSDLILPTGPGKPEDGVLVKSALSLADNPRIRSQLEYLLTVKRTEFMESLELSTRYLSHIIPILEKYNLPTELGYLCLIESGYRQSARSHAGAVGMWQMIHSTSKRFDLRTDAWVDERLDFIKSTEGASRFLVYLKERFDDWDHVLAAYNAGEGRVRKAIRRAQKAGLSPDMANLRLPRETRIYVPAFYAALLIAMEPERYGLFPNYQLPMDYIDVQVPGGVPLSAIAKKMGCGTKELRLLNPAILRNRVPVTRNGYTLRVPCTVGEEKAMAVAANLSEVRFVSYRVRKGDTLWDISRKFGVSISRITRAGKRRVNSHKIFPGETLLVALTAGETS